MIVRRDLRVLGALTVAAPVLLAVALAAGLGPEALFAAPAVALLLPLLAGRYVGERGLARLAAAVRPGRLRPRASRSPVGRRPRAAFPRGGRLIATALAVRPPPPLVSA